MLAALHRLRRESRAVAAVELAIVLPVLAIMALGAVDFVRGFTFKLKLQQYAQSGADFVVANGETLPTAAQVQDQVVTISGLNASDVNVTLWTECNQARQSAYGTCPGASDNKVSFMQILVTKSYQPIMSLNGFANFLPTTTMTGKAIVRVP